MRDMIAVLDGIVPNPNTSQGFTNPSGWGGVTRNVSGSGGANYSGGSNFYPGAPTLPSSEGLAGMEESWMADSDAQPPQDDYAGYLAAFSASPYVVSGAGDQDAARATGYQGRAFNSDLGWGGVTRNVSASGGANYSGGSNFFPGAPTLPSSEGLAALERSFGMAGMVPRSPYEGRSLTSQASWVGTDVNVSASGGANYSGGSSFFPGAPTLPSSEGLAALHGFLAAGVDPVYAVRMVRAGYRPRRRY